MSHITHMNYFRHTFSFERGGRVLWFHTLIEMRRVSHMKESHHTLNDSCHTYEWVTSHASMNHQLHDICSLEWGGKVGCSVLQCVAVCCSVLLQCVAVYCSAFLFREAGVSSIAASYACTSHTHVAHMDFIHVFTWHTWKRQHLSSWSKYAARLEPPRAYWQ